VQLGYAVVQLPRDCTADRLASLALGPSKLTLAHHNEVLKPQLEGNCNASDRARVRDQTWRDRSRAEMREPAPAKTAPRRNKQARLAVQHTQPLEQRLSRSA
jgi:hypothetical protein